MEIGLLNTTELNSALENMFKEEKDFIIILSPYLDLSDKIQAVLYVSSAEIFILYREMEKENKKIDDYKAGLPKCQFFCIPNFHAKAYITKDTLIITSLNLYENSQKNNFELGIILKGDLYDKIIGKLSEEIKILFKMHKLDVVKILDKLNPTVNDLFTAILEKSNKNEKDYADAELLELFSKQMMDKYPFERKDCWNQNEKILQRKTKITRSMYRWALENIKL